MNRPLKIARINFAANLAFSTYYIVFGILSTSEWLLSLGAYYLILSVVRFVVLERKEYETFITRFSGWMLIALSATFATTVILSLLYNTAQKFHMILMIAIAAYAFTKISLATINLINSRHNASPAIITLRNISFSDALASIFALQRGMLVSFEGMSENEIIIMNASLGSAIFILIFLLGINLIRSKKVLFKTLNT